VLDPPFEHDGDGLEAAVRVVGEAGEVVLRLAPLPADFGSPGAIGRILYTTWLYPFEITSILLLVAVVGAVVLAKRKFG
jgi:NADH:ubiquinone oxidoreductase subunit 6 (subunit J)